jgi:Protein of unknown function (DUF3618)
VSDARTSTNPPGDDPAALEAEIEATRARLAETVDELAVRIHPKTIADRATEDAKARLNDAVYTPDGKPRVERLAAVGAALAAFIALVVWRKLRKK